MFVEFGIITLANFLYLALYSHDKIRIQDVAKYPKTKRQ